MAKKRSPEDQQWDRIFSNISFNCEPPTRYIKDAVVKTRTGKRIKLSAKEFAAVMEQEKYVDPEQALIESCRVNLDFDRIKIDVDRFTQTILNRSSRRYKKSASQNKQAKTIFKASAITRPTE